jgi:3-hydroxyacyl-CoA dehydrogenase
MQEIFFIKKVAVLGAGVMGAQIAAHCVNAGIETLLFDLAAKEGNPNALVDKAIAHLTALKPSPLGTLQAASLLKAGNYEKNLPDLHSCDLVIEAIAERLEWKEELYRKIANHLNQDAVLVSNTSGLSINTLAEVLPETLRPRFCGVHFFNPPRYMHLAELIPAHTTEIDLFDQLETWLTSRLGKGVVRAKDTPNFIANRVGVFSLLVTLYHTQAFDLSLDEVDALTGSLLGRPKSATFRTMDVVGLDTMQHVVHTMQEQLTDDPWHFLFKLPDWLLDLVKEGHLGQKTGQGVYRKMSKEIEVYDIKSRTYRPVQVGVSAEVKAIMKTADIAKRMQQLAASKDKQAQFLIACYQDLFHYCAYHLQEIAQTVGDVDLAIRWGFGWQQGPFEVWEKAGLMAMRKLIEKSRSANETLSQAPLPEWLDNITEFYNEMGAYAPQQKTYLSRNQLPVYQRQLFPERLPKEKSSYTRSLFENEGIKLWLLKEDVAVVSFKSKANTIGQAVLDGLQQAIDKAEKACRGLIVYQFDANNFSSGADLGEVLSLVQANRFDALDAMIKQFQTVVMRLKYCSIPTVAALRGRALGGGCELLMHCDAVVAAFESYPGLVEAGVGLIPAGGGSKEMAMRAAYKTQDADLLLFLQPYFQQIATAFVAGSAPEAYQKGFLRGTDHWIMNAHEVLFVAFEKVKMLQTLNYQPPLKCRFKVAGREGQARLQAGLVNWLEGGFISAHDYFLATQLARVLCGGDVNQGELVDEEWILDREREAFINLIMTPLSQARITHLLETGKPLRN